MRQPGKRGIRALTWGLGAVVLCGWLLACTETASYPPGSFVTPTLILVPDDVGDDSARVELYAQQILAQQEQQVINATLVAVYAQQTATAEAFQATATARAWEATATAETQRTTATAVAWQTTVEAAQAYGTATAQAYQVQATATAQALAVQSTATAQVAATATAHADSAFRATATVEAVYFQATATAVTEQQAVEAALRAEQIRREQLATRREEIIYPVKAYGPWVILVAMVALILWGGASVIKAYALRLRAIPRDERGDAPVLILNQGRQLVAYDPDRAFGPATVFGADIQQPRLAPPEYQEQVTMRDQTIDAVTRGLSVGQQRPRPGAKRAAQLMTQHSAMNTPALNGPIRIVEPQQVRGWLRDVTPQALHNVLTVEGELTEVTDADTTDF